MFPSVNLLIALGTTTRKPGHESQKVTRFIFCFVLFCFFKSLHTTIHETITYIFPNKSIFLDFCFGHYQRKSPTEYNHSSHLRVRLAKFIKYESWKVRLPEWPWVRCLSFWSSGTPYVRVRVMKLILYDSVRIK